jgi:hypothetical protein
LKNYRVKQGWHIFSPSFSPRNTNNIACHDDDYGDGSDDNVRPITAEAISSMVAFEVTSTNNSVNENKTSSIDHVASSRGTGEWRSIALGRSESESALIGTATTVGAIVAWLFGILVFLAIPINGIEECWISSGRSRFSRL